MNSRMIFVRNWGLLDMDSNEYTILKECVEKALEELYQHDEYLIVNRPTGSKSDCHVSERGIVFRFGIYFQQLLNNTVYKDFNIDVEYNRNMYEKKMLPSFLNGTFPDLILHKRGSNDYNVLVLEFKTWWNSYTKEDINKIDQFIDKNGKYCYLLGASIVLEKENFNINWR